LRCLQKAPARRWQSLSDLGAVLEDLKEDTESDTKIVVEQAAGHRSVSLRLVVSVAVVAIIATVATVMFLRREPVTSRPLELERLTYDAGPSLSAAVSPDGNLVAFASDRAGEGGFDIWVRHIKQPEPTRLTDHPADDWHPRFSPDGSRLVFPSLRDGGGIYVMNALGGGLRKVAGRGRFPRFSPDGTSIVFVEEPDWTAGGLCRMYSVPTNGGIPKPFVPGWGVLSAPNSTGPVFSPDGRLVLLHGGPLDDPHRRDWWVAPVDGGEPWSSGADEAQLMFDVVSFPSVWLPGQLLVVAGTTIEGLNLYRVRISDEGLISGPVAPLTSGPGMTWMPTVSDSGRVALSRFYWVVHLWEVALDPVSGRPVGQPRRITDDASPKFSFSLSSNGDQLAYSRYSGTRGARRSEIVLQDRARGVASVAVTLPTATVTLHPRLSGDGSLLSWARPVENAWVSWVASTDNPVGRELCSGCVVVDIFSDGGEALVDRGRSLSRVRIADGEETTILDLEGRALLDTDLSRDDHWLAIQTREADGGVAIFAVPIRDTPTAPGNWVKIDDGDAWAGAPRWSPDGSTLYYLSERDDFMCVWGRSLDPGLKLPIGEPFPVAHAHQSSMRMLPFARGMWTLDVSRDRLVLNAGEMTGDVYTAMLENE
jgi:Tol biopolymer transport system component